MAKAKGWMKKAKEAAAEKVEEKAEAKKGSPLYTNKRSKG